VARLDKNGLRRKLKDKMGLACERHILLCTGSNCAPESADKTWRYLGKRFKELAAKGRFFYRTEVTCLKLCRSGPIALVYPEGVYYYGVTPEVCERIIAEHLLEGRVVEEFAFARVPLLQIEERAAAG
jgi:(2Fe-2S) ferredoxin